MMVSDAVLSRRSIRGFLPKAVETATLIDILEKAARAPSGGNVQPWHVYLVNGQAMADFRVRMRPRIEGGITDTPEYKVYPSPMSEPYRTRRFQNGEALYATLGIPREDKAKRLDWFARNFDFFGAPATIFLFVDRAMGAPQWSDLGGYLQTVMLLLCEAGLDSCPQEAWYLHHELVSDFVKAPPELMLFCGLSIGYIDPDAPVNTLSTTRADRDEWLTIL